MTASEFGTSERYLSNLLQAAGTSRLVINGGDVVIYTDDKGGVKLFVAGRCRVFILFFASYS